MVAFLTSKPSKLLGAAVLGLALYAGPVHAQNARDVAARLAQVEEQLARMRTEAERGTPAPENGSDILQRLLALERTVQQLTGQIEETRFTAERTAKQVSVMQDDLSLRLARIEQSLGVTGAPVPDQLGAAPPPAQAPQQQATLVPPPPAPAAPSYAPPSNTEILASRPSSADPGAAPPLPASVNDPSAPLSAPVSTQPRAVAPPPQQAAALAAPAAGAAEAAVNGNGGFVIRTDAQGRVLAPDPNAPGYTPPPQAPVPTPQQAAPRAAPAAGPVTTTQTPVNVSLPEGTPKQQYDFAFDLLRKGAYPQAEATLREFLQKHPKDPLAGNAQYWLGETYYVRNDFQQAAVEFMAGYQKYPKTAKAPDNLLKLGMSLSKLNQNDGACTALGRIGKDYPSAPADIAKLAKTERSRLKCKA